MKLKAEIDGRTRIIELKREGTRVVAEIDGRRYEVQAQSSHSQSYLLLDKGRVFDCSVSRQEGAPGSLEVTVNNQTFAFVLADPKRLRGSGNSSSHADGTAQIVAPMPGKVVRVLLEPGAEVEAGSGVIVVEAMKMQNELKSPKAGRISAINVKAGVTVNAGDVLAVIE